jgi:hypothetical protein
MIRGVKAALAIAFVLVLAAGAGCGSDNTFGGNRTTASEPENVIRAWAETLRRGDIAGAARFFAVPSVVANGTPPIVLSTRAEVRAFNSSLPCGAQLLRTSSSGRFTTAVFRLTERPGPGRCGTGTSHTARTTFVIRDGKIDEWRRVADAPQPAGPVV